MERLGLVGQVEKELEREMGAGLLPRDGKLPSEQLLARQFGVSRTTVREALRRLAARGLVVQRPGRRTRAVPLDEALTLENLGVALHEGLGPHSECRRLLEGYFALKREATVELLATCAEHASEADLDRLGLACFALMDAARWEEPGWVEMEFGLLRLAARIADRPGHLLLIQSLERAFQGMRARLMPHLDAKAVSRWADLASKALMEPAKLRRELPPLLRTCDERVLERLAPIHEREEPRARHGTETVTPYVEKERLPPIRALEEESRTLRGADAVEPHVEEKRYPPVRDLDEEPRALRGTEAPAPHMESKSTGEEPPGANCPNRSACRTGSCEAVPREPSPPEPFPTDPGHPQERRWQEAHGSSPSWEEKAAHPSPLKGPHRHAPAKSPPDARMTPQ